METPPAAIEGAGVNALTPLELVGIAAIAYVAYRGIRRLIVGPGR